MSLMEKLADDLRAAQKARDELVTSTLRVLKAEMTNVAIAKMKKELTDEEAVEVIKTQVKRLREAASDFEKGGRADLVGKNQSEIEILQKYLPAQMPEEEVRKITEETVRENQFTAHDFGKAMAAVMARVKGKAEGGTVSKILKELLSK